MYFLFLTCLLERARVIVWVLWCGGADWCGLVLGRVESWVRALGFSPFFSFPGPPGLIRCLAGDPEECRRADGSPQEPGIGNVFDGSGDRAAFAGAGGRSRGA